MTARIEQKTIFIRENDRLETVLELFSDEMERKGFKEHLNFVFAKQNNNYVGYYLFLQDNEAYKIIVLPKIIESDLCDEDKVRKFVEYLGEFFRLNGSSDKALASPLEIAFENLKNDSSTQNDLDSFLYHKYTYLIKEIEAFFKRHQKKHSRTLSYVSQSIRHRLDLNKNIRSIDKSRIHQQRKEEYIYSDMARIAYGALRLFMSSKVGLIADGKRRQHIEGVCRSLGNILLQKFHLDRSFSLNVQSLLSLSSFRYFRKSEQSKQVYRKILMLFGQERWFDEKESDIHYEQKGEYVFFRPEFLYERRVMEWLVDSRQFNNVQEKKDIGISYKTKGLNREDEFETRSEPDFMAVFNGEKVVVDAKWKVLNKQSDISAADILKLERDQKVHGATHAILAYCRVNDDAAKGKWETQYCDNDAFIFEVIEIPFSEL